MERRGLVAARSSLIVCKEQAPRTIARYENGLSRQEVERLCNSVRFMDKQGLPLLWAVIGDEVLDLKSGEARREFGRFKSQLGQAQKRAGYPQYWVEVLEVTGGLHGNCIFVGDETIARRLCRSFSQYMQGGYGVGEGYGMQPVHDAAYLASRYLTKERTIQANYGLGWSQRTRIKGSHCIEGGGDRVRLSTALREDAISASAIEPWQKTNARRSTSMSVSVAVVNAPETAPKPAGQLYLFQELERPITRLADFTAGILSPSASLELEHRRKRLGLSQSQLGMIAGLSQPQIANAVHGRFGLSRHSANRIKAALFPSQQRQAA